MQTIHVSKSSLFIGILLGFFIVVLPIFLLEITDTVIYLWLPGTSIVSHLGGPALHDRLGVPFLILGILIDWILYASIVTLVAEVTRKYLKQ
jgi:hypothetical protein